MSIIPNYLMSCYVSERKITQRLHVQSHRPHTLKLVSNAKNIALLLCRITYNIPSLILGERNTSFVIDTNRLHLFYRHALTTAWMPMIIKVRSFWNDECLPGKEIHHLCIYMYDPF